VPLKPTAQLSQHLSQPAALALELLHPLLPLFSCLSCLSCSSRVSLVFR
jgi:hypothetical protein